VRDIGGAHIVMGDQINQTGDNAIGKVMLAQPSPSPGPAKTPRRILLLMSNALETRPLRLDEEHRAISMAVADGRYRDQLELHVGAAPRYHDLQALIGQHRPAVVHFSGHSGRSGIVLPDDRAGLHRVPPAALQELFEIVGSFISCVVLNACLTEDQASAIATRIPCVVGMSRSVLDDVAIEFAAGFYGAVANGHSLADSFRLGRNRLSLAGLDNRDPTICARPGVAERILLTG